MLVFVLAVLTSLVQACDDEAAQPKPTLSRAELMNPETCKTCHPTHYEEWRSSMHAYAGKDPVFLAMNKRGQEETGGALGTFCVQCHAPMAVREELTSDGLNLDELPSEMLGVTCYFCHNTVGVDGHDNNPLKLANDTTMRGSLRDPLRPTAHDVEYSSFHDRNKPDSSKMCGACHDIVTPKGVHLERTFAEYNDSIFSKTDGLGFETCSGCHMPGRDGVAAEYEGVTTRRVHSHMWPGVDVALTSFPGREEQRKAVEECELQSSIQYFDILATQPANGAFEVEVFLETAAGHNQPSGATQDRRMWVELTAFDAQGRQTFQSGAIADDELEVPTADDSQLWLFRDRMLNDAGEEVHMFWEAAEVDRTTDEALPVARDLTLGSHTLSRGYFIEEEPARILVRVRMRPMSLEVLHDLVDSGHLDAGIVDAMPTFTVYEAEATWNAADQRFTIKQITQPVCD